MESEHKTERQIMRQELDDLKCQFSMLVESMAALTALVKEKAEAEESLEASESMKNGSIRETPVIPPTLGSSTARVYAKSASEPKVETPFIPRTRVGSEQLLALEARLKAIEGGDAFSCASPKELCLIPDVMVPKKFRVPDFEKYIGTTCPQIHLMMYCRKMSEVADNEKLLIHCFQDSLGGASLKWYMQLDNTKVTSWKDLACAFIQQYKYNLENAPDRMDLQNMEKENTESFKSYAQRWQELATQVQPPLSDKEMTAIFVQTLKPPYFEYVLSNVSSKFIDIVTIGDRVEQFIKQGLIADTGVEGRGEPAEEQEGGNEASHQVAALSVRQAQLTRGKSVNEYKEEDEPFPVPLSQIYEYLVEVGEVEPVPTKPFDPPYPHWYNPNATCAYHSGVRGHSLEECAALKRKVHAMFKRGKLEFNHEGGETHHQVVVLCSEEPHVPIMGKRRVTH